MAHAYVHIPPCCSGRNCTDRSSNYIIRSCVYVEDVVIPPGGGLLGRGVVLIHVQIVDKIDAALGCVIGFVVQAE